MSQEIVPRIVQKIAHKKGVEPSELDLSLYDYVDPDAIVELVRAERGDWTLSFDIPDYTVTIRSDGSIAVEPKRKMTGTMQNP